MDAPKYSIQEASVQAYLFADFTLDLSRGCLLHRDQEVKLRHKSFEVLKYLVANRGRLIGKEELIGAVWPDAFVTDDSLSHCLMEVRHALGESSQEILRTVPRRGYLFDAEVSERYDRVAHRKVKPQPDRNNGPVEVEEIERVKVVVEAGGGTTTQYQRNTARFVEALPRRAKLLAAGLSLLLLVAFLFWWSLRRAKPPGLVLTRLTSDSGLTTDAVISADGKLIAFASDRGGNNLDIWVRQVSGGEPIQLTRDAADDHQPVFSPDGSQIVFRSEREGGGIYIVSALGGEGRLLAPKGHNPRFSPAGDWIAYWVGPIAGHPFGAQAGKIFLIPPAAGAPKPIEPPGILAAGCPIWSSDGTHLLFYGNDSKPVPFPVFCEDSDWWVWPLAGGNPVKTGAFAAFAAQNISLTLPDLVPMPAEWVDDRVLFSAKAGDSVSSWQVSISPKNWRITGPAHRLTTGSGVDIRPSLAKTGLLVFSSLIENADIWSLPIDSSRGWVTGNLEQLTRDLAADYAPSMSADGKKLVYVSRRSGNPDIWMKDLESGKEKPLTESTAEEFLPRISPDGSLVSYASRANIYFLPAKGGLLQKVCDACGIPGGWSSDNKFLLFQGDREGRSAIGLVKLATGKAVHCLQSSEFSLFVPALTHDGRWITFVAFPRSPQVLAAPFQTDRPSNESDWIRITNDQHWNDKPRWSPNGDRIYFVSDRDGFACLWTQPLEPETKRPVGPPLPLYHIHEVRRSILNVGYGLMDIAVAPDKIVFNLGELTGNIWMTKLEEK